MLLSRRRGNVKIYKFVNLHLFHICGGSGGRAVRDTRKPGDRFQTVQRLLCNVFRECMDMCVYDHWIIFLSKTVSPILYNNLLIVQ